MSGMYQTVVPEAVFNDVYRGLSYSYPGSVEPALKDINFSLNAGETLAIVGLNGSGMTFSIRLMTSLLNNSRIEHR